jgi:hypothetical protein
MGSKDFMGRMRSELHRNLPISAAYRYKQPSCTDGSSTVSVNRLASEQMLLGDGEISFRHNITQWEDIVCVATSSAGSSLSLGDWHPATGRINDQPIMGGEPSPSLRLELNRDHPFMWEEKREKRQTEPSEVELMKERFAKLLLGDDMSGGAKGVCTALAISNAITNLSASLFRELWRLEPLADDWKMRWRMEMEWLLSVSDYIVEFVPSWQTFPDGTTLEVRTYQHISILYQVLLLVVSTCRALCHPCQLLLCCPLEHCFDLMSTIDDFDVGDGEPAPLRYSHKSSSFAHIGYHAIGFTG